MLSKTRLFWLIVFISILIFLGLSFKNPFGVRSLVANLEPFPDALYYSAPAWNLIHGKGFNMSVFSWRAEQIVPPLYSFYLVPFFAVLCDVRAFYYANILLLLGTIIFFNLILKKIFRENLLVVALLSFMFVTNFYIYNLPSLLMAENISLFFLMSGLYLLLSKTTKINVILLAVWGVLLWLIKFSNLPLGLTFYLFVMIKIFLKKTGKPFRKTFIYSSVVIGLVFISYLYFSKILLVQKDVGGAKIFSVAYFIPNLKLYLGNLFGGQTHYLWFQEHFFVPFAGFFILIGLFIGLLKKGSRLAMVTLLTFIAGLIIFMSFFYVQDARYLLVVFPLWLVPLGFLVEYIQRKLGRLLTTILIIVLLAILLTAKSFGYRPNERLIITFKKQLSLNFKYKEDPWNYLAVQKFNQFFKQKEFRGSYLGTFLPPFYINFFYNQQFRYLPLMESQDFFPGRNGFLEQMGVTNLREYYRKLLKTNQSVFVSNYYVANLRNWQERFDDLKNDFELILRQSGC